MNQKINITKYLSAISEPNRFAVLTFLLKGEKCACEIHPVIKIPQNLTSHHLKVLKEMKLLNSRREGNKILYSRNEDVIKEYQNELTKLIGIKSK